jgi:hypothetical protein
VKDTSQAYKEILWLGFTIQAIMYKLYITSILRLNLTHNTSKYVQITLIYAQKHQILLKRCLAHRKTTIYLLLVHHKTVAYKHTRLSISQCHFQHHFLYQIQYQINFLVYLYQLHLHIIFVFWQLQYNTISVK